VVDKSPNKPPAARGGLTAITFGLFGLPGWRPPLRSPGLDPRGIPDGLLCYFAHFRQKEPRSAEAVGRMQVYRISPASAASTLPATDKRAILPQM